MTRFHLSFIALIVCLLAAAVNAQYYANPQRSYMMGSPYGSYATSRYYGPRGYYGQQQQQQPYQQQYYQQAYRPYYNYYPQQQQQQQYSSSSYYNNYPYNYYNNYYSNYYYQQQQQQQQQQARAYSAPTMSFEAGPPNALVSAHLFCMNCGRGRQ